MSKGVIKKNKNNRYNNDIHKTSIQISKHLYNIIIIS